MSKAYFMSLESKVVSLKRFAGVFCLALAYFALMLPWNGFNDPDAFYHAKVASLLWSNGPLNSFPWLDLTLAGQHYADLHFLFHVLVAPFTVIFGMFQGLRLVSVLLAATCLTAAYVVLRGVKASQPGFWTAILAVTQPFVPRLLLGKASPLVITLYLLGILVIWRRKPWLAFVIALVYAVAHGGWLLLSAASLILAFGRLVVDRDLTGMPFGRALRHGLWKEVAAVFVGGLTGMLVHPNFPENFIFSWTQVFVIGLGTPIGRVIMGTEWLPPEAAYLVTGYAPWIIGLVLGLVGLALAPRHPLDREKAALSLALGILTAIMFAMTIKSRRMTEFLAPTVAIWCGVIWSLVDSRHLAAEAGERLEKYGKRWKKALAVLLAVLALGLAGREIQGIWQSLHPVNYADAAYRGSFEAVSRLARPGDRVFQSNWDEFPILFAADDRLRYIFGLDPTFLYVASSTLSDDVKNLTWGMTSTTKEQAWELIHERLNSRFVFVSKREFHQPFLKLIESDPRYVKLKEVEDSVTFEVRP